MTLLDTRKAEVVAKLEVLVKVAQALWPTSLSGLTADSLKFETRFDLRGVAAGQALVRGNPHCCLCNSNFKRCSFCGALWNTHYTLRFNSQMMVGEGWRHLFDDTVPHELAHLLNYHMGRGLNHSPAWRSICIGLGGTGERCHSEAVTFAKGGTFEYTTTTGRKVILSQIRHNRVQKGERYGWPDGSKIDRACAFKKVA